MLESPDWMREKIGDYRALSAIVAHTQQSLAEDDRIEKLRNLVALANGDIRKLIKDRETTIAEAREEQQMIKMELQDHWDVDGKTYNCDMGSATLRTTKTLVIRDNVALTNFLYAFKKLPEYINQFDMRKLRKMKEADVIDDKVVRFEKKTSITIQEATE